MTRGILESVLDELHAVEAQRDALLKAAKELLKRHVDLVSCGDCGHWDVEKEPEVIAMRAAIESVEGTQPRDASGREGT